MSERKLYTVSQPRTRRVVYERLIWADSADEAIAKAELGTAWPESYDELTSSIERGEWRAEPVTDEMTIEAWKDDDAVADVSSIYAKEER